MRFHLFLILCLITRLCSLAQNTSIIVIDKTNKSPLDYAYVQLESLNSKKKLSDYTSEKGLIESPFSIPYTIFVNHMSFENFRDTINQQTDTLFVKLKPLNRKLEEIVLTGQIGSRTVKESVNNIIQITEKEINESASNNLAELLNQESIFDLQIDPALGTQISLQGMQGNNINILIDGIPVLGKKGNQVDLSQLNLNGIERIEIIKGPASVSYGSNSTGGVINLIRKTNDRNKELKLTSYYENIGLQQHTINAQKKINKHILSLDFGAYNFKGFSEDTLRNKEWKSKDQYFGNLNWKYTLKNTKLNFNSYLFKEKIIDLGNDRIPPFNGNTLDHHYHTHRNTNDLRLEHKNKKYIWNGLISYANTKFNKKQYYVDLIADTLSQTTDPTYNAQDNFNAYYSRWEFNYIGWNKTQIQLGAELRNESVEGNKIISGQSKITEHAFFGKVETKWNDWLKTQIGTRIPYHSIYPAPITPSLHLKLTPHTNIQWRNSYTRGFRAPSSKELFMEFIDSSHNIIGNPNLKAEQSHSIQSSINWSKKIGENAYIDIDAESYLNLLEEKISIAQIENSFQYTYYNLKQSKYLGFTLHANARINKSTKIQLGWNHFIVQATDLYEENIPQHNFKINISQDFVKWNSGVRLNWKFKAKSIFQRFENEELVNYEQEAYQLMNISVFKNFPRNNIRINGGVKNLFDVKRINSGAQETIHSSGETLISWGKTYYLQLEWALFK